MNARASFLCGLASLACTAFTVHAQALSPRQELPKSARLTRPGTPHQLVVKFRDAARVRAAGARLVSLTGTDLSAVEALAGQHGASFAQLIRLPQTTLDLLEQRAAQHSGVAQPDLAGMLVVRAPDESIEALANALNALDVIEWVDFQDLFPPPPCDDLPPATPLYFGQQGYHGPDPGLNMSAAWNLGSTRGRGVKVADCEYGVVFDHEDLCRIVPEPNQTIHPDVYSRGWEEHGTAVFGEILSLDNAYGCTGLVPDAAGYFFPEWTVEEGWRRATAIANAIATVGRGNVVLLEMQTSSGAPAEVDRAVWTVVKNGTDQGVVVVAAAGNGSQNLDGANYEEYRRRGDSGAIIVGAGSADTRHSRLSFSTYGQRVNVQGWGERVFSTGYGDYAQHGGDKRQRYTSRFSGTSSASPFVTACAVALQSLADERLGQRLTPCQVRSILMRTGIPQGGGGGHIGPFPDMVAAAYQVQRFPADLDRDGCVALPDLSLLLADWGCAGGGCPGDADRDGDTDLADLALLLSTFYQGWSCGCP